MPRFRALYLDDRKVSSFRSQAPRKAPYVLTRSHYRDGPEVQASSPYQAWRRLRGDGARNGELAQPFEVGDALETDEGLLLCNHWGFDAAQWRTPPTGAPECGP